ncbi:MAG TPA: aminotransferase class I/II-fold pyridoxal phosphate-dependent enzyme [Trueperaceae bacterium]|nr:aminotransferase class I/II-fold pyridoxal phosphate-dependent enzyme [Trueperaceae bacterium]
MKPRGRSARMEATLGAMAPFLRFFNQSAWAKHRGDEGIADFVIGNPHEMPLPAFVDALERALPPRNELWFGYKENEPESREVVARSLQHQRGAPFEASDVFMTNGGFSALSVSIATLTDPGDEVIYITPPWFFYEAIIVSHGATPVRVPIDRDTYDLDLDAIRAAITERTRAIIINSPNNPTGRIYPPSTLMGLARVLSDASARFGGRIFLLSDEAYSRIVFDGKPYPSPTDFYSDSLLLYTYGKTLLTPGQRIGYIALPPAMVDKGPLREAIFAGQVVAGWAFPNALLQHALADLETVSIDIGHLQRKRDKMVAALRDMGYELQAPEGTFYLLVRSPDPDDRAFSERLAGEGVFVLPGSVAELPGTFRISLTASDAMIEQSLPGFERAIASVVA